MNRSAVFQAAKRAIVPGGPRYRRIPFGPAAGCVLRIDLHHQMRQFLGVYETELLAYFRELVRPGTSCFDVGGQDGYDALVLAKRSGRPVVSVECDHQAAEVMRETFSRNPYSVQVVEKFVCDRDDATHVTLDRLASETFTPDFIKMDIEGAEVEALRGARSLLAGRRPALVVEVHGRDLEEECEALLRGHGYRVQIVSQRRWLKETRPLAHNRWLVCRP